MTQFQGDWPEFHDRAQGTRFEQQDPLKWHPHVDLPQGAYEPNCRSSEGVWLPRMVAIILIAVAIVLGLVFHGSIVSLLSMLKRIGPGHSHDDQTFGLAVFGIIVLSILAAMKIALQCCDREHR